VCCFHLEWAEDRLARSDGRALATVNDGCRQDAGGHTPLQHGRGKIERVQFLPAQSVQPRDHSRRTWEVANSKTSVAKLVLRNGVLGLEVIKLLVGAQQTEPAANSLFGCVRRVFDLRVVLEAGAVAKLYVVAIITNRKNGVVPSALDAVANTQAVGAMAESERSSVSGLCIRARENTMRVVVCLAAGFDDLELLVQAQVLKVRVDAHGFDDFDDC